MWRKACRRSRNRKFASGKKHAGTGAAWGIETNRATVLAFTPEGKQEHIFANGIRNCVGLHINQANGDLWCATNERDLLGDNLVPDYVTRVKENGFYGWPWYYLGSNLDPRHKDDSRPDLAGKITVPDLLLQPHSAALQIIFTMRTKVRRHFPPSIAATRSLRCMDLGIAVTAPVIKWSVRS